MREPRIRPEMSELGKTSDGPKGERSVHSSGGAMNLLLRIWQGSRNQTLLGAAVLITIIALVDWRDAGIYFGFLYVFPLLLVGAVLRAWQIALTALLCTCLAEILDPFPFMPAVSLPQGTLLFTALFGMGLFSRQVNLRHRLERENRARIEKEATARREAEEQLEFLIQTSPVSILVMSGAGEILIANSAADHLFRVEGGGLVGSNVSRYVTALGRVPSVERANRSFRTEMECRGMRDNGDPFPAHVFFSTYKTALGPRLAAVVLDTSEDLRDRAEYGLEQLMTGSRILVGAVSHEVRNVCGAIAVVHENLARRGDFRGNQDFEALGSLVEALKRIASLELRKSTGGVEAKAVSLSEILEEARVVLNPYCAESDISVNWNIPELLPTVWADRYSLLHVLLNLTKNSRRALEGAGVKRIDFSVSAENGTAFIKVCDTGPGIASSENLFQPLQKGSDATGLGLFLSRAFMRSFGGELRYQNSGPGCCFVVELAVVGNSKIERT